ncbi:BLUF domain-containing protein [Bosea sp. (in: a-proteobacteria)]|uniref:BLUF domain-containing protein n=1 Tax=Bosea sp. (in: a-proteobacteria) TaxID=1871050 RepID=UPI0025BEC618|nr:BLUF domain-containing protein [Bosea sp. (in: a-proteobacteria)]MBR3193457.1 BLUF domain-containing protein [Bosea sp. (in: a-proteobacteria)]
MSLVRLVYASRSRLVEADRRAELARILQTARRLNAERHITGFLMATPGGFAQVLEGEAGSIAETYGRIMVDPRHDQLRLLAQDTVADRQFAGWAMALAEHNETTAFIFGLYGVSPETEIFEQPLDVLLDLAAELASARA